MFMLEWREGGQRKNDPLRDSVSLPCVTLWEAKCMNKLTAAGGFLEIIRILMEPAQFLTSTKVERELDLVFVTDKMWQINFSSESESGVTPRLCESCRLSSRGLCCTCPHCKGLS